MNESELWYWNGISSFARYLKKKTAWNVEIGIYSHMKLCCLTAYLKVPSNLLSGWSQCKSQKVLLNPVKLGEFKTNLTPKQEKRI